MGIETHITEQGNLYFDGEKCIHSRNCVLNRPDVFVPDVKGEWIHPENASSGELHAIADNCPSGAIRYEETGWAQHKPLVNTLHIRENGPYALNADLQLGEEPCVSQKMTLCRCGASKNKPYCDGSHVGIEFVATGEVAVVVSAVPESQTGVVIVSPLKDGPVQVDGNLEICTGTGHTVNRVQQVHLCRCGHSSNKPYCDGTHSKVDFTTES